MIFLSATLNGLSQEIDKDQKVFLITVDGLRWQELFSGADSLLIQNKSYVKQPRMLMKEYWRPSNSKRREVLMPFIWKEAILKGQIFGNRDLGSKVDLTNKRRFSYPGYNEILTGKADDENITSNSKKPNSNKTILEEFAELNNTKKVAAFSSWDVFDYIINEERSGVYSNSGFESSTDHPLTEKEKLLNVMQKQIPSPWSSVRFDSFTHQYALAYLNKNQPDFIYIAYGETDDFAHNGEYDSYLKAAKNTDQLIKDLWSYTQNNAYYKGKTIFFITTDHGRGTAPIDSWKSHGANIEGSDQTWFIVFGEGVTPKGEMQGGSRIYSNQIAPTIRNILGLEQNNEDDYGKPIKLD
jgi:hypothetical protein